MVETNEITEELTRLARNAIKDGSASCCGILEALKEMYPLPLDRPIVFSAENGTLDVLDWAIRMINNTPKGNISQKTGPVMFIAYCPFCGELITDQKVYVEKDPRK